MGSNISSCIESSPSPSVTLVGAEAIMKLKPELVFSGDDWNATEPYQAGAASFGELTPVCGQTWLDSVQIQCYQSGKVQVTLYCKDTLTQKLMSELRKRGIAHFDPQLTSVSAKTPDQVARVAEYLLENFKLVNTATEEFTRKLTAYKENMREPIDSKINVVCTREEQNTIEFRPLEDDSWFRTFWVVKDHLDGRAYMQVRYPSALHTVDNLRGEELKQMASKLSREVYFLQEKYEIVLENLIS